jgi:uncharacterized protein (DUF1778 family)
MGRLESISMSSPTVNVNTTQPADWAELARKAASLEGVGLSEFVGLAMVDRAFAVLKVDPVKGWKKLSKRTRGRPKND